MTQNMNATDRTAVVLHEIARAFGRVPNLFQAYAKYPPLLEANWSKVKAVLLSGSIRRMVKETIALQISHDNGCAYCVAAHSAALRGLGIRDSDMAALLQGDHIPALSEAESALLRFARKTNLAWREMDQSDLDVLKQLGVSESEVVEVLGVVELFSGFNRFARTMHVEVDF